MELKNAITICLISLFSATLVLLIARSLDLQAASRLEPQLTRIVEELAALRQQGGIAPATTASRAEPQRVTVYYLHSSARCVTCRAVEAQTHEVLQSDFAAELKAGTIVWKSLNYEAPPADELAKKFGVASFAVVLAKMQGGEVAAWKKLDRAGAIVGDEPRFAAYVREELKQMIRPAEQQPPAASSGDQAEVKDAVPAPTDKPLPAPADLPIPQ
jgi:hypothetical protein